MSTVSAASSPSRFSVGSGPSTPASHKATSTRDFFGNGGDEPPLDCLEEIKKAIDNSSDKISGLQDSLSENKARLAAILGIGGILEKTHSKRIRTDPNAIARSPSEDSVDRNSVFYANIAEMTKLITEDVHANERAKILIKMINQQLDTQSLANIAGSPKDPQRKELRRELDQLKREKAKADGQLGEKTKLLADRNKEVERLQGDLHKCTSNGTAKSNELAILIAHVREIEGLIQLLTQEGYATPPASPLLPDTDLVVHNSRRFLAMIAILKAQKASQRNGADALSIANKTHDDLRNEIKAMQSKLFAGDQELAAEVTRLRDDLDRAEAAKAGLNLKYDRDLDAARRELLETANELKVANRLLIDANTQLGANDHSHANDVTKLRAQLAECGVARETLAGENEVLGKKVGQLTQLYQAALQDKKNSSQDVLASQRSTEAQAALEREVSDLQVRLAKAVRDAQMSDDQWKRKTAQDQADLTELIKQNKELKDAAVKKEVALAAKLADLTGSLKSASEDFSTGLRSKGADLKNNEKTIADLQAALDANRKELITVNHQNAALEAKIGDLHRQILEKKSFVKGVETDEVTSLRKELAYKSTEVSELRDRNTELAIANATYLEQVIQTENNLNGEIAELREHIASLNEEHLVETDDLRRMVAQLNAQYFGTTARDAEKKMAFTKESFRAHLRANGVKVFHWEDMETLMKKVEELHNRPNAPIVSVSDLIETTQDNTLDENGSPRGSPLQRRKSSLGSLKSFKSRSSMPGIMRSPSQDSAISTDSRGGVSVASTGSQRNLNGATPPTPATPGAGLSSSSTTPRSALKSAQSFANSKNSPGQTSFATNIPSPGSFAHKLPSPGSFAASKTSPTSASFRVSSFKLEPGMRTNVPTLTLPDKKPEEKRGTGVWVHAKADPRDPYGDAKKKLRSEPSHREMVNRFEQLKQANSSYYNQQKPPAGRRGAARTNNGEEDEEVVPYEDDQEF